MYHAKQYIPRQCLNLLLIYRRKHCNLLPHGNGSCLYSFIKLTLCYYAVLEIFSPDHQLLRGYPMQLPILIMIHVTAYPKQQFS